MGRTKKFPRNLEDMLDSILSPNPTKSFERKSAHRCLHVLNDALADDPTLYLAKLRNGKSFAVTFLEERGNLKRRFERLLPAARSLRSIPGLPENEIKKRISFLSDYARNTLTPIEKECRKALASASKERKRASVRQEEQKEQEKEKARKANRQALNRARNKASDFLISHLVPGAGNHENKLVGFDTIDDYIDAFLSTVDINPNYIVPGSYSVLTALIASERLGDLDDLDDILDSFLEKYSDISLQNDGRGISPIEETIKRVQESKHHDEQDFYLGILHKIITKLNFQPHHKTSEGVSFRQYLQEQLGGSSHERAKEILRIARQKTEVERQLAETAKRKARRQRRKARADAQKKQTPKTTKKPPRQSKKPKGPRFILNQTPPPEAAPSPIHEAASNEVPMAGTGMPRHHHDVGPLALSGFAKFAAQKAALEGNGNGNGHPTSSSLARPKRRVGPKPKKEAKATTPKSAFRKFLGRLSRAKTLEKAKEFLANIEALGKDPYNFRAAETFCQRVRVACQNLHGNYTEKDELDILTSFATRTLAPRRKPGRKDSSAAPARPVTRRASKPPQIGRGGYSRCEG